MAITLTFTPTSGGGGGTGFRQGKLGGGGHIAGFDFSADGKTRIALNDTTGGFMWASPTASANPVTDTAGAWRNLIHSSNVPAYAPYSDVGFYGMNVYSACHAPSNPLIIYAVWPTDNAGTGTITRVMKSTDRGATWSMTAFTGITGIGQTVWVRDRLFKPHMGVDPKNANVVWIAGGRGEWYLTFDGFTSAPVPLSTAQVPLGLDGTDIENEPGPNPQIAFDGSSALTSGRTSVFYIANGGRGVYKTTNGGSTFTAMTGGPTTVQKMRVDALGRLYALRGDYAGTNRDLWWLDGSTWTNATATAGSGGYAGVHLNSFDINPFDNNEIMAMAEPGQLIRSTDRGVTWTALYDHIATRVATDIPWLAYTNEDNFSNCDLKFDPVVNGRLWVASGIGIWYYDRPTNFGVAPTAQTFTELTRGNDGLIVMQLVKASGGSLNCVVQDRIGFRLPDTNAYPTKDGAPPIYGVTIQHGWNIDYASNPAPHSSFLVRMAAPTTGSTQVWGYSTNDGDTWTPFATRVGTFGGVIVASTATNHVLFEGWDGKQFYTTNNGGAWSQVTWKNASGTAFSPAFFHDTPGFLGFYTERKPVCADRVTAGVFYAYHWDYANGTDGFYKSTDGGANFIKQAAAALPGSYGSGSNHLKMAAVPGKAGNVFMATGFSGAGPIADGGELWFSNDGWATKSSCGFNGTVTVGFGKAAPSATYPAVYVWGCRSSVPGLWRCTDWDGVKTWTLTSSSWTNVTIDRVRDVIGDLDVYGRVYMAFASTGYAVGDTA